MKQIKAVIFDIDGVLEFQGQVYPGAIETLAWLRRHRAEIDRIAANPEAPGAPLVHPGMAPLPHASDSQCT